MNSKKEQIKCIDCGNLKPQSDYDKETLKTGEVKYRRYCKYCRKIRRKASLEERRIIIKSKTCSKCGNKKPASNFHKNSSNKDGLVEACKKCVKARSEKRAYEPIVTGKKVCSKCQEEKSVSEFHVRRASKDGLNASCKPCQLKSNSSRPVNRVKANKASLKHKHKVKREVFKLLGGKCCKCGYLDPRALQVDHINADHGLPQGAYKRSGHGLYIAIRNGDIPLTDFQLLCANCNWLKRYENNEVKSPPTKDKKFKEVVDPAFEKVRSNKATLQKRRDTNKRSTVNLRNFILDLYGNCCNHCGYSKNCHALQVDHIKQAEETSKQSGRSGESLYRAIKNGTKNKDDFQLLCANCNWVKRYTNQEHRHRVE